jgi:2-alkenal reductase
MKGFLATLALILSLGVVACSGEAQSTAASADEAQRVSVASVAASQASTAAPAGDGAASQIASSTADEIVAAHEAVLTRIYDLVQPSVVHIQVTRRVVQDSGDSSPSPFGFGQRGQGPREFFRSGEGTGFLWDEQGHIVTNYHVVQDADRVTVIFADDTEVEAEVLGGDPDSDLAVLKVDVPQGIRPVDLGDSDALRVGQMAVAIGNPFGQTFTMTRGIVSAIGRTIRSGNSFFSIPNVIQTDAPINPGNSGGPLLDRRGRVIGINTQIISSTGGSTGIGFAVPINTAKRVVPGLIRDGRYDYAWLGISGVTLRADVADIMGLPDETRGVLIITVGQDSPADKAGLGGSDKTLSRNGREFQLGGDVIVAVNGTPVRDMDALIIYLIEQTKPGDRATFDVVRDGDETTQVEVKLGTRPHADGAG